jgi:DNA-binding CsgD family transcriptional regulator
LAELGAAIDGACSGSGTLVLIEGDPGIGKSRLCAATCEAADAAGMRLLRARGGELEQDLTYGIAKQLFERCLAELDPKAGESILSGPARLAGMALDPDPEDLRLSSETGVSHGLYWLVSNLAELGPVALVIDDAQWADAPSLRFLLYLSRRLDGLPVALIVATRSRELISERQLLDMLAGEPICRRLALRPLSPQGVKTLLEEQLGRPVAEQLVTRCHEVSGGNPFLLGEIARSLTGDDENDWVQSAGLAPKAVTRTILLRLGQLGATARATAEALAAAGDGVGFGVLCDMVDAPADAVGSALDTLAANAITTGGSPLSFVHPIVRTAIYGDIPHWRRQDLHARAAHALRARRAPPEEIAHHFLLTEPAGDPETVPYLRMVAHRSLERGAHENAVRLLARALREPPADADRAAVLTELSEAEFRGGRPAEAGEHAIEALGLASGGDVRVRAAIVGGGALMATGRPVEALQLLETQAREGDGEDVLRLETERVTLAMWVRGVIPLPWLDDELARFSRLAGNTTYERLALTQAALAAAYDPAGDAETAASIARRALGDGALLADLTCDSIAVGMAAYVLILAEDLDAADPELARILIDARDRGSLLGNVAGRMAIGQAALVRGRLGDAAGHLDAALVSGRELWDSPVVNRCVSFAVSFLTEALLHLGNEAEAREVIEKAQAAGDYDRPDFVWSRYGRGLLRLLADENPAGAAEDLIAFGEASRAGGFEDRVTPWRQWGALALAQLGREEEARALADEQLAIASAWSDAAHGAALRDRALVGPPDEAEPLLGKAAELLEGSVRLLDRARVAIDHGVALRRLGSRTDARTWLERGLELAARCEAAPLIERARSELAVLGARPRRLMFSGLEGLTASERRVAAMAAEGMSNREIASSLFVTIKTVETHLGRVYRKLDISSRAELPATLAASDAAPLTASA